MKKNEREVRWTFPKATDTRLIWRITQPGFGATGTTRIGFVLRAAGGNRIRCVEVSLSKR